MLMIILRGKGRKGGRYCAGGGEHDVPNVLPRGRDKEICKYGIEKDGNWVRSFRSSVPSFIGDRVEIRVGPRLSKDFGRHVVSVLLCELTWNDVISRLTESVDGEGTHLA